MASFGTVDTGESAVAVLTAVTEPAIEAALIAAFERRRSPGLVVARRCVDLADLLAVAATRIASAAIVSPGLRRLDREALARLEAADVAVVGVVPDSSEPGEILLRQLGVRHVVAAPVDVPADGEPATRLAAAVGDAVRRALAEREFGGATERFATPVAPGVAADPHPLDLVPLESGVPDAAESGPRLVAVWGPTGAPGRSTVAWHLAGELAARGARPLVVDADVYGGVLAQLAGLVDEAPGLIAACRAANLGALDLARLAALCRRLPGPSRQPPDLQVLTGLPRASRWPELRPSALEVVLGLARRLADVVLVDCGFCLEEDEELSYDTAAPRRNGATATVLQQADAVLAVGSGDPIGLTRLVHGLDDLRNLLSDVGAAPTVQVVLNRMRSGSRSERREVTAALERHAGARPAALLPLDVAALDEAQAAGDVLAAQAPRSPLRQALADLAGRLVPIREPEPQGRRRRVLRAG